MAFNCTADRPDCLQAVAELHDDRWFITASIGYDTSGPHTFTYYFIVHTYPKDNTTEFAFCLMQANNTTGEHGEPIYDSSVSNSIIPTACRQHIGAILQDFARKIIAASQPPHFKMETFCLNLPPQAIVKYSILCQIFASLGYTVTQTPTDPGRVLWIMNKL